MASIYFAVSKSYKGTNKNTAQQQLTNTLNLIKKLQDNANKVKVWSMLLESVEPYSPDHVEVLKSIADLESQAWQSITKLKQSLQTLNKTIKFLEGKRGEILDKLRTN